jgi:hypothetical protein
MLGEVTNKTGKPVHNVSININYFDESGKKLVGSSYTDNGTYSDGTVGSSAYIANGVSIPFKFIRFANKVDGKIAKVEVKVTGTVLKSGTCAVLENINYQNVNDGSISSSVITGNIKCTGGTICNSYGVVCAVYDATGNLVDVQTKVLDGAPKQLTAGQSHAFKCKVFDTFDNMASVKAFPYYQGDFDDK